MAGSTVGTVEDIDVSSSGTAEVTFTVDDDYAPLRARHPGDRQAHLAVRHRQPLHRPPARPRQRRRHRGRRPHRVRSDRHGGRAGRGLLAVRQGDAQLAARLHQGPGGHAARPRRRAAPGHPLPQPGALDGQPPVPRADPRRAAAEALRGRLGDARERAGRAPRRPDRGRLEPERHVRGARKPAGGAGRVGRAAAAVPAARRHHLREPARRARRRGPAGRRRQAGRAPARAVPRPGADVRERRRADDPRPVAHDPRRRLQQRPDRADQQLPAAQPGRARRSDRQRRRAPRRVPRDRGGAERRGADDRVRPPLHARLRGLARRLLDDRRLRRALAATRGPGSTSPSCSTGPGPKIGQFRRCPGANEEPAADGSNVLSAAEAAALDCDPSQRSVGP